MQKNSQSLKVIASSSIGTILEWYDFSLFAFLTPMLASNFFPQQSKATGFMFTYGIFAIGFFGRPIGAALFGHIGDRIGRKRTLILSIVLMALPTFLIGLLPTYKDIGIYAAVLLLLLRICQGLSAGGESTGAVLFVMEGDNYKNRGFIGGILWGVVGVGMLLGSLAASIVTFFPEYTWAWRVPFILGIFTGLIGYFVRKRMPEPIQFQKAQETGGLVKFPLYEGIKKYKKELLRIIGIYTLSALITYLIFIFMPGFAANVLGFPLHQVSMISSLALAGATFLMPLGGYISDLIGRKNCLRWSAILVLLLSYPLFLYLSHGSLVSLVVTEIIFVILASCYQGTINATTVEMLPVHVRYSLIAVGYNIAYSIFGGTAPIVAMYLVKASGNKAAPGIYLMFGALIAILATVKMRETRRLPLVQEITLNPEALLNARASGN
jgi:MHS family proline/betaine transporter-like MFS transporter